MNEQIAVVERSFMNNAKLFLFESLIACIFATSAGWSRDIAPIVSTDWLSKNIGNSKIVVLDVRSAEQYKKGHVPGAFSAPFALWAVEANGLNLELPSDQALKDLIGKLGIKDATSNFVVIVNRVETDFARADATRVAWTCMIAGLKNVAVLDGGYTKWVKENRDKSTDMATPDPVVYTGMPDKSSVVLKSYVLARIGKSILVDTRIPEEYFGIPTKPGHIKSAVDLPAPWIFKTDGTFKEEEDLRAMAAGVLGEKKSQEAIIYCGFGGYASAWWFLLTQVIGYKDVKLYDGSMEEWIKDPNAPVSTYCWH